jgi:hypothetical protein
MGNTAIYEIGKYLLAVPLEAQPDRITKVWDIVTIADGYSLGVVKWYGSWRRYCFFPTQSTVFEERCLNDIARFITDQTREHRASNRR